MVIWLQTQVSTLSCYVVLWPNRCQLKFVQHPYRISLVRTKFWRVSVRTHRIVIRNINAGTTFVLPEMRVREAPFISRVRRLVFPVFNITFGFVTVYLLPASVALIEFPCVVFSAFSKNIFLISRYCWFSA